MSCGPPGWRSMCVQCRSGSPAAGGPARRARALRCRREPALRPRKGQPEAALAARAVRLAAPAAPAALGAGAPAARFGRAPPCCRSRHFSAMRAAPPSRRTASLTQSAWRAGRAQGVSRGGQRATTTTAPSGRAAAGSPSAATAAGPKPGNHKPWAEYRSRELRQSGRACAGPAHQDGGVAGQARMPGSAAGRTWRDATAAADSDSAKRVRRSSPTNWLSCECVRLQKMTWRRGSACSGASPAASSPSLPLLLPLLPLAAGVALDALTASRVGIDRWTGRTQPLSMQCAEHMLRRSSSREPADGGVHACVAC